MRSQKEKLRKPLEKAFIKSEQRLADADWFGSHHVAILVIAQQTAIRLLA
jgi:hypothetical protein